MTKKDTFMDLVQSHEREWGNRTYAGRPSLAEILKAPVVTFWHREKEGEQPPYIIRLYQDLKEVEKYLTQLILRSNVNTPPEKLTRIYANQKRVTVRDVQITFREMNEES